MRKILGYWSLLNPGMMDDFEGSEGDFCASLTVIGHSICKIKSESTAETIKEDDQDFDHNALNKYQIVNAVGSKIVEYDNDTGMCKYVYNQPIDECDALPTIAEFERPIYEEE